MLRSPWFISCTSSAPRRSRRRVQARLRQSRPYCGRLLRAAIYPLWLSVKPARVAISGRRYPAHIGMVTACDISAKKSWVTSAGHAQSYVVSSLAPEGAGPTDSTLYLLAAQTRGLSVAGPWDGLGLRANASSPIALDDCEVPSDFQLTDDGAGFPAMLNVVLPLFSLGTAAVALGIVPSGSCWNCVAPQEREIRASRPEPRREPAYPAGATRGDAD